MIDLRGTDGNCFAPAYSELLPVAVARPEILVLEFKRHRVEIRGRNLMQVYQGLAAQIMTFLRENDMDVASEADTLIDSLTIAPRVR